MTKREQERCDAALSYLKDSKLDLPQVVKASSYFIAGAEWSDKNILDKACEWIKEHIDIPYEGKMIDGEPEVSDYIEWTKERLRCAEEVAESFRKAMEEEL